MEVATGDDPAATGRGRLRVDVRTVGEDERIVGGRIDLDLEHPADVGQRIGNRAVDLRHAANRVWVLDLVRLVVVRADQCRVA